MAVFFKYFFSLHFHFSFLKSFCQNLSIFVSINRIMHLTKIIWIVISITISLGITPYEKNFNSNQELFAFLIENNTSSFLISQKGDLIINEEFEVKKSLKPTSLMFFNLFQHGFIENRSQEDVASIQKSLISILIGIAHALSCNQSITSLNPVVILLGKIFISSKQFLAVSFHSSSP